MGRDLLFEMEQGLIKPHHLTEDETEELVGEMAMERREWVPLCPTYPELKGIECAPVEAFNKNIKKANDECGPVKLLWAQRLTKMMDLDFGEVKEDLSENSVTLRQWRLHATAREGENAPHWMPEGVDHTQITPIQSYIWWLQYEFPELKPENSARWEDELKANLIVRLDPEMRRIKEMADLYNQEADTGFQCALGYAETGGSPYISHQAHTFESDQEGMEQACNDVTERDYWNSVRVLSRDDMFDLARDMGRSMHQGYDLDLETYRAHLKRSDWHHDWSKASYEELGAKAAKDDEWQRHKKFSNYKWDRDNIAKELEVDDVINDEHTIFVTTPRGGLEFLGIFAYAHNIPKARIPSFYTPAEKHWDTAAWTGIDKKMDWLGKMIGSDWLNNRSEPVDRVVLVDDTIESGEQQLHAHRALREFFGPKVDIVHMAACGRRKVSPLYYNQGFINNKDGAMFDIEPDRDGTYAKAPTIHLQNAEEGIGNIFDDAILGKEMYNFQLWRILQDNTEIGRRDGKAEDEIVTCAFPWSISDSKSSQYLRLVYGTRFERGRGRVSRRSEHSED